MTADLLNTLVGLSLTYAAIFPDAAGMGRDRVGLVAAVAMIGLALWARRSSIAQRQSTIALATGVLLGALMIAHQLLHMSDILMFWGVLWAGPFARSCRYGQRSTGRPRMRGAPAKRVGWIARRSSPLPMAIAARTPVRVAYRMRGGYGCPRWLVHIPYCSPISSNLPFDLDQAQHR